MKQEVTTKKYSSAVSADRWLCYRGTMEKIAEAILQLE